jgi:hypothetical protein
MRRTTALAAAAVATLVPLSLLSANPASATTAKKPQLYVLTTAGVLTTHDGADPGKVKRAVRVKGLAKGDRLVGIDTRPATGAIYALGRTGQLYTVSAGTGQATRVGTPSGAVGAVGFDFNPTVDRIRVVGADGRNLRLNPDNGQVAGVDTPLAYAAGDKAGAAKARVTAAAYTNSVKGATSTVLFDLDAKRNALVVQGSRPGVTPAVSPNTGQLNSVTTLRVDVKGLNGFDITGAARSATFSAGDYTAVASVRGLLYRDAIVKLDLRTGKTTYLTSVRGNVVGLTFAAI